MLGHYDSLPEALSDLRSRGFKTVFGIKKDHIYTSSDELKLNPSEFDILESYRFEGSSDPSDSVVVYAIEGHKDQLRGTLVIPSGNFSEELTPEMSKKFEGTIETL